MKFTAANYLEREDFGLTSLEKSFLGQKLREFLDLKPLGFAYYRGQTCVGLLLLHRFPNYPALNAPTNHIGYWGYDPSQVDLQQAEAIKSDWLDIIQAWQEGGARLSLQVLPSNGASIGFARKLGFTIVAERRDVIRAPQA